MVRRTASQVNEHVRQVSDAEVAAYREQGWVELPGLLSEALAGDLLSHLKQITGLDYDALPPDHPEADAVISRIREQGIYSLFSMPRLQDQEVWEVVTSHALGEASARLAGVRPMRLLTDGVICKLPAWTEERMQIGGRLGGTWGGETPWHQDFTSVPWDRAGGVQFWIALSEITPEMGSMQHLTGSHREPPLGGYHRGTGATLAAAHPELWEKYELSEPHHFKPGDVLAHHPLTVHYAQANRSDRLRWVYTSYRIPADTLYTGIPFERFDDFGITFQPWQPFEHPKFPIVTD